MRKWIAVAALTLSINANASEKEQVQLYCDSVQGVTEWMLLDKTRVDCLTDEYAIEADWAYKWYEAVGQSLHYAMHTGRRAAILLIIRTEGDWKYARRLQRTVSHYGLPITVFTWNEK